jgi:hypothetical protein
VEHRVGGGGRRLDALSVARVAHREHGTHVGILGACGVRDGGMVVGDLAVLARGLVERGEERRALGGRLLPEREEPGPERRGRRVSIAVRRSGQSAASRG